MKRILLSVAVLIQYSSVVTTFRFEPMHAAPPISHGEVTRISLGKRQDCPFGVVCGGGCAVLGPCCDEVTGCTQYNLLPFRGVEIANEILSFLSRRRNLHDYQWPVGLLSCRVRVICFILSSSLTDRVNIYRTTCTTISSCLDATDPICVGGAPDNFFCWYV